MPNKPAEHTCTLRETSPGTFHIVSFSSIMGRPRVRLEIQDVLIPISKPMDGDIVVKNLSGCARCGGRHQNLRFSKLTISQPDSHSHWAMCPCTNQPVMLKVVSDQE